MSLPACCLRARCLVTGAALVIAAASPALAQYSDYDFAMQQAERDSLAASYHNIFPILGHKAVERGIRIPAPLGLNVNYFTASQGIAISNLALAVNGGDFVSMNDIFKFDETQSDVENVNFRGDLWVLPFLNVYGLYGQSWATTSVSVSEPFQFTSRAEMQGSTYGGGFTAAGGMKGFWFSYDTNWTWSDLDVLDKPVRTRTMGIRVGKNYRWLDKSIAAWVGAMKVELESGTEGTVKLSDVLPGIPPERNEDFQNWYDSLTPAQQKIVDRLFSGDAGDTEVSYRLDKAPTTPWTMAVGAQIELSRHWQFRTEFNFLGDRTSILANLVFRIDI